MKRDNNILSKNEKKARAFMEWYSLHINELKNYVLGGTVAFDEDMFSDAFLRAYNAIARNGTDVKNYAAYFLQSYRATFLDAKKKRGFGFENGKWIDRATWRFNENEFSPFDSDRYEQSFLYGNEKINNTFLCNADTPVFAETARIGAVAFEYVSDRITREVLEYVRKNYDDMSVSLFEIYLGLFPDVSYKRLSRMLGVPFTKIWPIIGAIKKDLLQQFGTKYYNALEIDDF